MGVRKRRTGLSNDTALRTGAVADNNRAETHCGGSGLVDGRDAQVSYNVTELGRAGGTGAGTGVGCRAGRARDALERWLAACRHSSMQSTS